MELGDICLVMIVKDEAKVIEKCLDSLKNLVSEYLICDTGSTDGTPDIIRNKMKQLGIPGRVIYKSWKNFGYNRNHVHKTAFKYVKTRYLCWIDADETFVHSQTNKPPTREQAEEIIRVMDDREDVGIFMVNTNYNGTVYPRYQFCRNNQRYKWRSPVHEYLIPTEPCNFLMIEQLCIPIFKVCTGKERYYSDIEKLENYVRKYPDAAREVYYLAQSYRDTGQNSKALGMFKKRAAMDNPELAETYLSYLNMGRIYSKRRKWDDAIAAFQHAHETCPDRVEAPFEIASCFYRSQRWDEGFEFVCGYELPEFILNRTFIEPSIHEWEYDWCAAWIVFKSTQSSREEKVKFLERAIEKKFMPSVHRLTLQKTLAGISSDSEAVE